MTRKHFESFAAAIKGCGANDPGESRDYRRGVEDAARAIAQKMAEANPRFDRARFLAACGIAQ